MKKGLYVIETRIILSLKGMWYPPPDILTHNYTFPLFELTFHCLENISPPRCGIDKEEQRYRALFAKNSTVNDKNGKL